MVTAELDLKEPIAPAPTRRITYIANDLHNYFDQMASVQQALADNHRTNGNSMGESMHGCFAKAFQDAAALLKSEYLDKGMGVIVTSVDIDLNGRTNPNNSFMALYKRGELGFSNYVAA